MADQATCRITIKIAAEGTVAGKQTIILANKKDCRFNSFPELAAALEKAMEVSIHTIKQCESDPTDWDEVTKA
jgi:hypothetical protein